MIEICAIASGSNGNCYYIGNENEAVLIDAGISCKQILLRLKEKNLDPQKVKGIFISHEHSDHIRGARVLAKKLICPVYLTAKTYNAVYKNMRPVWPEFFAPGTVITIGELEVYTFLKNHDASEPCSFRVSHKEKHIGVFTDIGDPCINVVNNLAMCDAAFLESNYDENMLHEGPYPYFLKKRIASSNGHLSNMQSFRLLRENAGNHMKCVFLSHLSAENNTPHLAMEAHQPLTSKFEIKLTSRSGPGEVYIL
jgi:phosphoribosyl 1,2-cyclic phosphodiesterase